MATTRPINLLDLVEGPPIGYTPIPAAALCAPRFIVPDSDEYHSRLTLHGKFWGNKSAFSSPTELRSLQVEGLDLMEDKLFIFNSYIRALTRLKHKKNYFFSLEAKPDREEVFGCLISGTPGIGKTTLLHLYLIISLALEQPILIQLNGTIYFHTSHGLFIYTRTAESAVKSSSMRGLTMLLDLDRKYDAGVELARSVWCIGAASPNANGREAFMKHLRAHQIVLDNPKHNELSDFFGLGSNLEKEELSVKLEVVGPNLRQLRGKDPLLLASTLRNASVHLSNLSSKDLSELFKIIQYDTPTMSAFSHAITISIPQTLGDTNPVFARDNLLYRVRSLSIMRLITQAYQKDQGDRLRELYVSLHADRNLGTAKGWVFESLCHDTITNGTKLELLPMKEVDGKLHRSWGVDSEVMTETLRIDKRKMSIFLSTNREDTTRGLKEYYVPAEGNNPTFDSFLHSNIAPHTLYAFQMTVGSRHSMKVQGLKKLVDRAHQNAPIRLIFLIVPGSYFAVPKPPRAYESKFEFFTCEMEFDSSFEFPVLPADATEVQPDDGQYVQDKTDNFMDVDSPSYQPEEVMPHLTELDPFDNQ